MPTEAYRNPRLPRLPNDPAATDSHFRVGTLWFAVMTAFKFVSVTLSMLLGLGVTRLLTGLVGVFQSRAHVKVRWPPLVWAGAIFIAQIQFWWAVIELDHSVTVWTLGRFASLLVLPLLLFLASALVLPSASTVEEDLEVFFERDGRWALACLSLYALVAMVANAWFFRTSPLSVSGAFLAVEAALPLIYLRAKSSTLRGWVTASYFAVVVVAAWVVSPHAY
jgi:hypothetical protein